MDGQQYQRLVAGAAQQFHPQQRTGAQVERSVQQPLGTAADLLPPCLPGPLLPSAWATCSSDSVLSLITSSAVRSTTSRRPPPSSASASPATVGSLKTRCSGRSTWNASRIRATTRVLSSE